jgi:hypothetical protein
MNSYTYIRGKKKDQNKHFQNELQQFGETNQNISKIEPQRFGEIKRQFREYCQNFHRRERKVNRNDWR